MSHCTLLNGALACSLMLFLLFGLFAAPFYLGYFALHPGIACLGYVHYGVDCLASQSLLLGRSTLGWLVLPVIHFPLLCVHPKHTYCKTDCDWLPCCNHLDGQLNCQAFTHQLISVTIMYQLCYW